MDVLRRAMGALALWALCGAAGAQGGSFELLVPERGWRGPTDAFRIRVPSDIPLEVLQRLALELDGIDVTRFLRREGELAVFEPVEPLAYGEHELRIVEYLPDGSIAERAVWKVEVRQSRAFREADGRLGLSLTGTARLADGGEYGAGPRRTAQGSADASVRIASGEWRASADIGLGYDTTGNGSPTGRRLDLQNYALRHEWRAVGVSAGVPMMFGDGLLGGTYGTRGVGLDLGETTRSRVRLRTFVMRGEPVSGFREGLGITDPDNRLAGAQLTIFPLAERPERLVIQARTYRGETPTSGEGVLGVTDAERGVGHAIAVDSTLRDGRLRLHAELARTRWDPDGRGAVLGYRADSAYALGLAWGFVTGASGRTPTEWTLTAGHGEIGPYFRSLLDASREADQRATQLGLTVRRGGLGLALSLQRVRNNVDDLPDLATSRLDSATLDVTYEFSRPVLRVLTSLGAQSSWQRVRPLSIPSGTSAATLTDDRNRTLVVTAGFSALGAAGSLTAGVGDYRSYVSAVPSTESWTWRLGLSRGFLENRLNTSFSVGRDFTRDVDTGAASVSDQAAAEARLAGLRGNRLTLGLGVSLNRIRSPADPSAGTDAEDTVTRSLMGDLSWALLRGSRRGNTRPAASIGLSATWQETERRIAGTTSRDWYVGMTLQVGIRQRLWAPPAARQLGASR